jgi:uncharacterized membrane protein YbhN (UPF0104 family)
VKKYLRITGSLLLLALLGWRLDWGQVARSFASVKITWWLGAVGLYGCAQCLSVVRWQMMARVLGFAGRWRQYLAWYFIGMFFNLVLPTSVGGDVIRAWYLSEQHRAGHVTQRSKRPRQAPTAGTRLRALTSVVSERANGLVVLILISTLATALSPLSLPPWIVTTVALAGGACLAGLLVLPLLGYLRPLVMPFPRLLGIVDTACLYLKHPGALAGATLLSLVIQSANVVLAWLVGQSLGLAVPLSYFAIAFPLVTLLTLLPISVNGMGLREAGLVMLLAPVGVAPAQAVTLSLLIFAALALASLLGAGFHAWGAGSATQPGVPEDEAHRMLLPPWEANKETASDAHPVGDHSHQGRDRQPPAAA